MESEKFKVPFDRFISKDGNEGWNNTVLVPADNSRGRVQLSAGFKGQGRGIAKDSSRLRFQNERWSKFVIPETLRVLLFRGNWS